MKANELRLGSIISDKGLISTVITIDELGCTTINNGDFSSEVYQTYLEYKPIPLTEEWLIKFGFLENGYFYHLSGLMIYINDKEFEWSATACGL